MAKLMLIDGNSLLYRAFFALPTDMATASGQVTNAVFGFTRMLVVLLREHRPDQLVATFDRPEPTFRHEKVDAYKAGRQETPDILRQQMGLARQLIEAMAIPLIDWPGLISILASPSRVQPRRSAISPSFMRFSVSFQSKR